MNNNYEIIREFIESPYSLRRFCFNKQISSTLLKKEVITKLKKSNPELLIELDNNIKEKDLIMKRNIGNDIYSILERIKEDPINFSLIDVCLLSNYDVLELIGECDNYLEGEDRFLFRRRLRPLKVTTSYSIKNIEQLINSKFTFNIDGELVEISKEDIQTVVDYLNNNNIPIYSDVFKNGCIKLYQKKLFLNNVK